MKYKIIGYALLLCMIGISFIESNFKYPLLAICVILYLKNEIYQVQTILKRSVNADFGIKKKKQPFRWFLVVLLFFQMLMYWFSPDNISIILIIFMFIISEIIIYYLFKNKNPYALVITDNQLYANDEMLKKRDLKNLISIKTFELSDFYKIEFENQKPIHLDPKDYDPKELKEFFNKMINLSQQNVEISNLVKKELELPTFK